MVRPSKNRDSRKVESQIISALQGGNELAKHELRPMLNLYGSAIVNSTVRMLVSQKVLVETKSGKLTLTGESNDTTLQI